MTTHLSQVIIMRIKEFGESDLLVTFFTPDKGQQKGVAKGARRSLKRFVNCLDLFSLVNLEYRIKKTGGDLCFINSGKLVDAYPGLRCDFSTLTRASYMIELTEILFPSGVADEKMFLLLRESLRNLEEGSNREMTRILFEARAMALGGYKINLDSCSICGRTYTGRGSAVFKRERGGIACLNCESASKIAPSMSPSAVELLGKMQTGRFDGTAFVESWGEILEEIASVLKLHREYRLGLRPKTARYLES